MNLFFRRKHLAKKSEFCEKVSKTGWQTLSSSKELCFFALFHGRKLWKQNWVDFSDDGSPAGRLMTSNWNGR